MQQLLFIHWGTLAKNNDELYENMKNREINPFETRKRRRHSLEKRLPEYQIIKPEMPNKDFASYKIRKLWFEKHLPFLNWEKLVLIGHSLGGMFLIKYLWENSFPLKIHQLHLVAPVLDEQGLREADSYLGDFAYEESIIKTIEHKAETIFLWHSKDDPSVPFAHSERIKALLPKAHFIIFEDRGHFSLAEFPELIESIKKG